MRLIYRLLVVGLALVAFPVLGQEKIELTADYSKCMERAAGVDPAMRDCIADETLRQDKKLNDTYKKLLSKLTPERKK